jgi:hypothetical protein
MLRRLDIKYTMGIPPTHHERQRNKRCEERSPNGLFDLSGEEWLMTGKQCYPSTANSINHNTQ